MIKKKKIGIVVCMLVIATILLCGEVSAVPSLISRVIPKTTTGTTLQQTWIVDNEPGDGNFTLISVAIADSQVKDGDIIDVYSGTYIENVIVNKQLIINGIDHEYKTGSDTGKPDVQSYTGLFNDVFKVVHDSVTIEGFKASKGHSGIDLVSSKNHHIINNFLTENYVGVWLYMSDNNEITDNNMSLNYEVGIYLDDSNTNTIEGNWVEYNPNTGIWIVSGTNNLIYNNFFKNPNNAMDGGSNNRWNVAPIINSGFNICKGLGLGLRIGGNYWSDYKIDNWPFPPWILYNVASWHPAYTIPGTANSVDKHPIPGFEFLVFIAAFAIAFIILRKRKSK